MKAASEPPASGPIRKPEVRVVVVTRQHCDVSLIDSVLPIGRALLATRPDQLAQHGASPGAASVLVYDARHPAFDHAALLTVVREARGPVVIWGVDAIPRAHLDELCAARADLVALPASVSGAIVAQACLEVVGQGAAAAQARARSGR